MRMSTAAATTSAEGPSSALKIFSRSGGSANCPGRAASASIVARSGDWWDAGRAAHSKPARRIQKPRPTALRDREDAIVLTIRDVEHSLVDAESVRPVESALERIAIRSVSFLPGAEHSFDQARSLVDTANSVILGVGDV